MRDSDRLLHPPGNATWRTLLIVVITGMASWLAGCLADRDSAPLGPWDVSGFHGFHGQTGSVEFRFSEAQGMDWDGMQRPMWRLELEETTGAWVQTSWLDRNFLVVRSDFGCRLDDDHCQHNREFSWHDRGALPPAGFFWNEILQNHDVNTLPEPAKRQAMDATIFREGGKIVKIDDPERGMLEYTGAHPIPSRSGDWILRDVVFDSPLEGVADLAAVGSDWETGEDVQPVLGADRDVLNLGISLQDIYDAIPEAMNDSSLAGACVTQVTVFAPVETGMPVEPKEINSQWTIDSAEVLRHIDMYSRHNILGDWIHEANDSANAYTHSTCDVRQHSPSPKRPLAAWHSMADEVAIAEDLHSIRIGWGVEVWNEHEDPAAGVMTVKWNYHPDYVARNEGGVTSYAAHSVTIDPWRMRLLRIHAEPSALEGG